MFILSASNGFTLCNTSDLGGKILSVFDATLVDLADLNAFAIAEIN